MKRPTLKLYGIACWLLLGLAGRVFVPAGFMVMPGEGGWPVVPCPGPFRTAPSATQAAQPAAQPTAGHGSHSAAHGHEHPNPHQEHPDGGGNTACYLGAFFALAAEVDAVDDAPACLPESRLDAPSSEPSVGDRVAAFRRPRGPPAPLSVPA